MLVMPSLSISEASGEAEGVLQLAFAILPKTAAFVEPTERELHNPAFGDDGKGVQLVAFGDLDICTDHAP